MLPDKRCHTRAAGLVLSTVPGASRSTKLVARVEACKSCTASSHWLLPYQQQLLKTSNSGEVSSCRRFQSNTQNPYLLPQPSLTHQAKCHPHTMRCPSPHHPSTNRAHGNEWQCMRTSFPTVTLENLKPRDAGAPAAAAAAAPGAPALRIKPAPRCPPRAAPTPGSWWKQAQRRGWFSQLQFKKKNKITILKATQPRLTNGCAVSSEW